MAQEIPKPPVTAPFFREKTRRKREKIWDDCEAEYRKKPFRGLSFEEARTEWVDLVSACKASRGDRPIYQMIEAEPGGAELRAACCLVWQGIPDHVATKADYVAGARALTCFAFLRDGKWAERGQMGWWAIVTNENEDWDTQLDALVRAVPDDHYLTVVDCHI